MIRYPPLSGEDMNHKQKRVAEAVDNRRDGGLVGPFVPLVYVPEILDQYQLLGEYCRFNPHLPRKLVELAILITARHIGAPFEFYVHTPPALDFGVSEETVAALADRRRPADLGVDEALIYDFCTTIYETGRVGAELFTQLGDRFGKPVALDLIAICGYYATLGMVLNVTQMSLPSEAVPPFEVLED